MRDEEKTVSSRPSSLIPHPSRLVTLTGSGGTGKSRLSLQVAADLLDEYADGVWLVELAALADPALVPQAVATTLGVREEPGKPLTQTLVDFLKGKRLLLILDNCEHLLAACAGLVEGLLRSCPQLRVLASSREGLNIAGEQTYRVPSLSLPDPRHSPPSLEGLTQYEAVRLFIDRAVLQRSTFAVTNQNAPAVAQLCHRLDGIPLAIELAAARVKALPVEQIAARLDDMFRLLTGGSRTALPRQQTLRALIDWSYDLLAEPERALLRRLSVFAGGWTLDAAESVCAAEGVESWAVLDLLTGLVEKSLVVYEDQGEETRYHLLETVRQYARDRLRELGEAAAVRDRHRDWFVALAQRAAPYLQFGAEERAWMERLEREHDNLRAALEWCQATEEGREAGLRAAGALTWFWVKRGHLAEGWQIVTSALAAGSGAPVAARGKALFGAIHVAQSLGDIPAMVALAEEGLGLGRESGDRWLTAASLNSASVVALNRGDLERAEQFGVEGLALARELGDRYLMTVTTQDLAIVAGSRGDYERARTLYQEALDLYRELEDTGGIAVQHMHLGWLARQKGNNEEAKALWSEALALWREVGERSLNFSYGLLAYADLALAQGDPATAKASYEEALAIARELNDQPRVISALLGLAKVARAQGDHEKGRALLQEGEAAARAFDNPEDRIHPLGGMGHLARDLGDYERAAALYRESLALRQAAGKAFEVVQSLEDIALLAALRGQAARAARLLGAAEAQCAAIGAAPPVTNPMDCERAVAAARARLGEQAFAAAWTEGRALPLQDAIEYALEC